MKGSVRTAISLPWNQYRQLESLRKKLGLSRSGIFQRMAAAWIKSFEEKRLIEQYVRGYERYPEKPGEIAELESLMNMQAEEFEPDEWSKQ